MKIVCFGLCVWVALVLGAPTSRLVAQSTDPVLVGAGDIGACPPSGTLGNAFATASLLDSISGTVFAAGDLPHENGADSDYAKCYEPTWGRFRARTIPAPGNHDYVIPNAMGYYNYWGPAAGDPTKGYYSLNIGLWHVIVLNSECDDIHVGGCSASSPQGQWLQADLNANPALCTVALWHRPLYSSTSGFATSGVQPLWQILYNAGADLVINGHAHNYERFAPQDANGNLDTAKGLRQFIVGTGGADLFSFSGTARNVEVNNSSTFGVLKLTLHATSYDWQFIPIAGQTFTDSGTQACH
jgi:calcineurin-like phosphoesterase family protein